MLDEWLDILRRRDTRAGFELGKRIVPLSEEEVSRLKDLSSYELGFIAGLYTGAQPQPGAVSYKHIDIGDRLEFASGVLIAAGLVGHFPRMSGQLFVLGVYASRGWDIEPFLENALNPVTGFTAPLGKYTFSSLPQFIVVWNLGGGFRLGNETIITKRAAFPLDANLVLCSSLLSPGASPSLHGDYYGLVNPVVDWLLDHGITDTQEDGGQMLLLNFLFYLYTGLGSGVYSGYESMYPLMPCVYRRDELEPLFREYLTISADYMELIPGIVDFEELESYMETDARRVIEQKARMLQDSSDAFRLYLLWVRNRAFLEKVEYHSTYPVLDALYQSVRRVVYSKTFRMVWRRSFGVGLAHEDSTGRVLYQHIETSPAWAEFFTRAAGAVLPDGRNVEFDEFISVPLMELLYATASAAGDTRLAENVRDSSLRWFDPRKRDRIRRGSLFFGDLLQRASVEDARKVFRRSTVYLQLYHVM